MSLIARKLLNLPMTLDKPSLNLSPEARQFQFVGGRLVTYLDIKENYLTKGYDINDIVFSLVDRIMDKCRIAPWGVYTIEDESAYKKLRGLIEKKNWTAKDYYDAVKLHHKALKPVKSPGKWGELLKYANDTEDFQTFISQCVGYMLLMGNNYIWGRPLKAGANAGMPNDLHLLPAQWTDIWALDQFPVKVTKYTVGRWPGLEFLPPQILHQKTWNPSWEVNGVQLYGVSPLRAALGLLNRSNNAMLAGISNFADQGIKGILHMKTTPGSVDSDELIKEVGKLKEVMATEWSGPRNRGRMGLSGYDMGWLPVGQDSEEMQLIESEKWDLRRLCNIYKVQSQILNDPDNKTYNNQKEAVKAMILDAVLPQLCRQKDTLNRKASQEWGLPSGQVIDFDLTVYGELQEGAGETMTWYEKLIAPIPNEQRELAGLSTIDDERYNEPWPSMGRSPQSEVDLNIVDESLNDDDTEEDI